MPDYEIVEPHTPIKGLSIWTASTPLNHFQNRATIYVLTSETFYFGDYLGRTDHRDALNELRNGDDPDDVLPPNALVVPLEDIVRVEKVPNTAWLSIRFQNENTLRWRTFACPDALGNELFHHLRQRLAQRLRFGKERQSIFAAAAPALGCLLVVGFFTMFVGLGSLAGDDSSSSNKYARGATMLGKLLGPVGVLILGSLAGLGVVAWMVCAIVLRPLKKVLRDDGTEDRTGTAAAGPEPSRSRRPAGRRQAAPASDPAKLPFISGVSALVLGVPALCVNCLPWGWIAGLLLAGVGLLAAGMSGVLAHSRRVAGLRLAIAGGAVNAFALMVAFILTLMAIVHFAQPGKETSSFRSGSTIPGWGKVTDPDGDCTFEKEGDTLTLRVPASRHDLVVERNQMNSPRALQEVTGDFRIEVKVAGLKSNDRPSGYQSAGLLLWVSKSDYIRLECVNPGSLASGAFEVRAGGRVAKLLPVGSLPREPYLCLERRGGQLLAFVSADGRQWTPLEPLDATLPNKVSVGIVAVSTGSQEFTIGFEKLRLETK